MAFGPYEHGVQFLISHRVYEIIAKYRLPIHNKITAKIDTFSQNYYLVGFPMLPVSVYDFNKSRILVNLTTLYTKNIIVY